MTKKSVLSPGWSAAHNPSRKFKFKFTPNCSQVREVYERAVSNLPPAEEKRYWQRYIYLWINYALFEELEAEDPNRAREVYRVCLNLIPHRRFTFAKVRKQPRIPDQLKLSTNNLLQTKHMASLNRFKRIFFLFACKLAADI